jgi:uncharacterized protein YggE
MSRVYLTILILGFSFICARFYSAARNDDAVSFSLDIDATESTAIEPDIAEITFDRVVDLSATAEAAKRKNDLSVKSFLQGINSKHIANALTITQKNLQNDWGITQSFTASRPITVRVTDLQHLPAIIETALQSGMNTITFVKFSISKARLDKATGEAKARAYLKLQVKADEIAAALGLKAVQLKVGVSVPPGDPVVSGGFTGRGYGAGSSSSSAGGSFEAAIGSATVSIHTFVKNLADLVEEEPEFSGALYLSKTLVPEKILVTQSASLPYMFRK